MSVKQRTLKSEFSLNGKGLHTGKQVTATFKPAEENFGYRIRRMDLEGSPEIPALAEYVKLMDRASCLEKDGVCVFTMEHAMAALYGCGIDNCLIELSGEEFPILDGSAKYYVEEIEKVGFEEQKADRRYFTVKEQMEFCSEDGQTKITLLPDTDYNINLVVAYDSPYLQMQYATYSEKVTDFAKEIAPCRTFVFLRELEMLLQHNLIKGGDLDNAIVIVDREISQEEVNRLASEGMPFRDAYKKVGLDIEAGNFSHDKTVHHTHAGSIGNLCNDKIEELMQQVVSGFNFEKVVQAENSLLGR